LNRRVLSLINLLLKKCLEACAFGCFAIGFMQLIGARMPLEALTFLACMFQRGIRKANWLVVIGCSGIAPPGGLFLLGGFSVKLLGA
jgi:hypothetical protein